MYIKTFLRTTVALGVAIVLLNQSTLGQDQWINPFGGFYHSPFNWQDTTPPGATESALFGLNDTYTVVWNSTTGNTFSTQILVPQGDVTFRGVGPDRTYTVSDDVELSGGDLTLGESTNPLDLVIADALRVQGGSRFDVRFGSDVELNGQLLIGSIGGDGSVGVVGLGSTLINSSTNNAVIGLTGNFGSLSLSSSAFASINASLNIAASSVSGSEGSVIVDSGAEMIIGGDVNLLTGSGNEQAGFFYTIGGTVLVDGNLNIGTGTGSSQYSSFSIGSGSLFVQTAEGTTDIGGVDTGESSAMFETDGDGEFVSGTGPITIHPSGYIYNQGTFTANGPVVIENGGALIIEDGEFEATTGLENSEAGTLEIRNGTMTISGGHFETNSNSFKLNGVTDDDCPKMVFTSGASGNVNGQSPIYVGRDGNDGELALDGGSSLSVEPFSYFGWGGGSAASVTVSGAPSHLIMHGGTFGLDGGSATLHIVDGGRVTTSYFLNAGDETDGSGSIIVDGVGSILDSSHVLQIGTGGHGFLRLNNGGCVQATELKIAPFLKPSPGSGRVRVRLNSTLSVDSDVLVAGTATVASGGIGVLWLLGGRAEIGGTLKIWDTGFVYMEDFEGSSPFLSVGGIDNSTGGTFSFQTGTLEVENFIGDLINQNGRLAPGPDAEATAIIGSYTQQAGGTLDMEVGGTSPGGTHDVVTVSGVANLDGQLELSLINGYLPGSTDVFFLLSATSLNGFFDNINTGQRLDVTGGQGSFVVNYGFGSAFPTNQVVLSDFLSNGPVFVTPDSFMVTRGQYVGGDEVSLADSDNADLSLRRLSSDIQSRTEFEVKSTSPIATPASFEFTLEGAVFARSNVVQTIELYDYVAAAWVLVDTRNAVRSPSPDMVVTTVATGDLSRFVEAGTMCIEARVRYRSGNPRQNFASNTDQAIWTIE